MKEVEGEEDFGKDNCFSPGPGHEVVVDHEQPLNLVVREISVYQTEECDLDVNKAEGHECSVCISSTNSSPVALDLSSQSVWCDGAGESLDVNANKKDFSDASQSPFVSCGICKDNAGQENFKSKNMNKFVDESKSRVEESSCLPEIPENAEVEGECVLSTDMKVFDQDKADQSPPGELCMDVSKIYFSKVAGEVLKIAHTIALNKQMETNNSSTVDLKRKREEEDDQGKGGEPLNKVLKSDNKEQIPNKTDGYVLEQYLSSLIIEEMRNENSNEIPEIEVAKMLTSTLESTNKLVTEDSLDMHVPEAESECWIVDECYLNKPCNEGSVSSSPLVDSLPDVQKNNAGKMNNTNPTKNDSCNNVQILQNNRPIKQFQLKNSKMPVKKKVRFQLNEKEAREKNGNRKSESKTSSKIESKSASRIKSKIGVDQKKNSPLKSILKKSNEKVGKDRFERKNHAKVVAAHYNVIRERNISDRNQSYVINLRNFNNWIKNMLIQKYTGKIRRRQMRKFNKKGDRNVQRRVKIRVLDLCCGKGGDLHKWKNVNVNRLICADISKESVKECKRRYKTFGTPRRGPPFRAEFIVHDCTQAGLVDKFKRCDERLDLVSCQFALHYSFESRSQVENMLQNASKNLKAGGYFIGTVPNEIELLSRWYKSNGNKFGNEIYSVEFQCDKLDPPFYGAKYNFYLKDLIDCPEFLVNSAVLQQLALKYGLQFIVFKGFKEFYEQMKVEGGQMLHQMRVLHPPYCDVSNSRDSRYRRGRYERNSSHQAKTLSQAEWDVITLYSVFVFRKTK